MDLKIYCDGSEFRSRFLGRVTKQTNKATQSSQNLPFIESNQNFTPLGLVIQNLLSAKP